MGDLNRLSHFLARLLRHDARDRGLDVTPDGYVDVDDVLSQGEARGFNAADVQRVVNNDNKGRFKIRHQRGVMQIKATQGHSMRLGNPDLTPINHHLDARVVLHGTRRQNWPSIKANGLSRKGRTHIHFAEGENERSGFPPQCDMVIELNLESAMNDGLQFYRSENRVILSTGNHVGVIPSRHIKRAYDLRTHDPID